MKIVTLRGKEILPYLDRVAMLRIQIFRQWPYLYEGDLEMEKNYLKIYADSEESILILAKEGDQVVGVAMGLPVNESIEQVQKIFNEKQVAMENCYYFADAILLEEYRGKKIGLKMIQDFEQTVKGLKTYGQIYGFEILRDQSDPRKPSGYKSLDAFWDRLGYGVVPDWQAQVDWLDVGDAEKTTHSMRFRKKDFSRD